MVEKQARFSVWSGQQLQATRRGGLTFVATERLDSNRFLHNEWITYELKNITCPHIIIRKKQSYVNIENNIYFIQACIENYQFKFLHQISCAAIIQLMRLFTSCIIAEIAAHIIFTTFIYRHIACIFFCIKYRLCRYVYSTDRYLIFFPIFIPCKI